MGRWKAGWVAAGLVALALVGQPAALAQSNPPLRSGPAFVKSQSNYAPVAPTTQPTPRIAANAAVVIAAPPIAPSRAMVIGAPPVAPPSSMNVVAPPPTTTPTVLPSGGPTPEASTDSVNFTVTGAGLAAVELNGLSVATGGWTFWDSNEYFAPDSGAVTLGAVQQVSSQQTSPTTWRVVHKFKEVQVVYDYVANGEDITVTANVANQSLDGKPMKHMAFKGLTLKFPSVPVDKRVDRHFWSYFRTRGWDIAHPSYYNPLGAWMLRAGPVNFSFAPLGIPFTPKVLVSNYDATDFTKWSLIYLIDQDIPAGESRTVKMTMRFSSNGAWAHMLEPYKNDYQQTFTQTHYQGDARPLGMTACSAMSRITPDNPHGFAGPGTRFDLDQGVTKGVGAYLNNYTPWLQAAGAQGVIFWDMQGFNPRGAMYRPDFDVFPPEVAANVPKLIAGMNAKGLRVGMLARPGEIVVPASPTTDTTQRISSKDSAQMAAMWNRFNTVIGWGVTDFYLDTFGNMPDDVNIMRQIRAKLNATGQNIQTFAEFGVDVMLPYTGFYTECSWDTGAQQFVFGPYIGLEDMRIFRWLMPNMITMAQVRASDRPAADVYRFCLQEKVLPLVPYWDAKAKNELLKSITAEFVDPTTNWWKDLTPNTPQVAEVAPLFD
ncbi:MAG: hypothetical protein NTW19_24850 [Planctomycetota bacterium]|nr:hypothetical protein [Planctomycetota bacterium]